MADPSVNLLSGSGLIGGSYRVAVDKVLPGVASPFTAYAAHSEPASEVHLMAVSVARGWSARAWVLTALTGVSIPNLITPLAHGAGQSPSGEGGYFVICPAPQGASLLATLRPWSEAELLQNLLRPVTAILADLQQRNLTHRALRPDNVFQLGQRGPVTVGQAWAAPPAAHQPDWLEPPYSAKCLPCGRGNGSIADDIYALGAMMVMLSAGAHPFPGLEPDEILRRKLEVGSYAALTENQRLSPTIADLARGMLADDPEHRPSATLLSDPQAARARRLATRPARRSPKPLELGSYSASTARTLAHALNREAAQAVSLLSGGLIDRWLRRALGDSQTAILLDEVVKLREVEASAGDNRADARLVTRAVAILDPCAPLTWRSVSIWPDGLGAALDHALHHDRDKVEPLCELAVRQIIRIWGERRSTSDTILSRLEAKDVATWAQVGQGEGGALRLNYTLNALSPCESPSLGHRWVTRLVEVLPALEAAASNAGQGSRSIVDAHLAAFMMARRDERLDVDLGQLGSTLVLSDPVTHLRLLARLQQKLHRGDLPALSKWAGEVARPLLDVFDSRSRRDRLALALEALAPGGQLARIVALIDNANEVAQDQQDLDLARVRVMEIDASLNALDFAQQGRSSRAQRTAHDVTGALGLVAVVAALALAAFS